LCRASIGFLIELKARGANRKIRNKALSECFFYSNLFIKFNFKINKMLHKYLFYKFIFDATEINEESICAENFMQNKVNDQKKQRDE
jgi:hypothetical protein